MAEEGGGGGVRKCLNANCDGTLDDKVLYCSKCSTASYHYCPICAEESEMYAWVTSAAQCDRCGTQPLPKKPGPGIRTPASPAAAASPVGPAGAPWGQAAFHQEAQALAMTGQNLGLGQGGGAPLVAWGRDPHA